MKYEMKKNKILIKKYVFTTALSLVLLASGLLLNDIHKEHIKWDNLKEDILSETGRFRITPYIVIVDTHRNWHIDINENHAVPAASLVKVPIMAIYFRNASKGKIDLQEKLTMKSSDKVGGSGKLRYKRSGTEIPISELIELMITKSDNTATNMLINRLGMDYLNQELKKMGLKNTNLSRLMMHMEKRDKGIENYTTAKDMALIFKRMYRGRLFSRDISNRCIEILKNQKSKNRIPAKLPKNTVVAHKTGLERSVCHDTGIIYTDNGDIIICVLTSHKNGNSWPSKIFTSNVARLAYDYQLEK